MKSFRDLVQKYESATGRKFEVIEADNSDVSESCLAAVMPDGRIKVWKDVNSRIITRDKEEALAHEMMHKIINRQVLCIEPNERKVMEINDWNYANNFEELDYELAKLELLSLEINNSLSHEKLIAELLEYGIQSKRHIRDRLGVLEEYKTWMSSAHSTKETSHCIGLMLYDLERTVPGVSDNISRIVCDYKEISRAYSVAKKYFLRITTGSDLNNQEDAIKQFLLSLEYDPDLFTVHNF